MNATTKLLTALTLSLCTFACDAVDVGELEGLDEVTAEIVENLLDAGYPMSEIEVDEEGQVIVGGDGIVSLEGSREMAGAPSDEGFRQYRTSNQVSASIDTICIDGSALSGASSTGLNYAIDNYNYQAIDLSFVRTTGMESNCDALITANTQPGDGGEAKFPANGLPGTDIWIGTGITSSQVAEHVVAHEIGHAIGLRHTDYYDRSISCNGAAENEGWSGVGVHHVPGTPTDALAQASIMNSCYYWETDGEFTHTDANALEDLYGTSFCDLYDGQLVALRTAHGRYVRAGNADLAWAVDQQTSIGAWEKFTVVCGDEISLRSTHGRYLMAGNHDWNWAVNQQPWVSTWERFTPVRLSGGGWAFATDHGRYLRAGDANLNWTLDQQTGIGSWERFTIIPQ